MKYNILKAQSGTKIPLSPRYKNYPKPRYQGEIKKDETSQLERSIDNFYRDKIKSTPIEGIIKTIVPSAAIASGAAAGPILTTAKGVATAAGYGALQGLGFGQLGMGSGNAVDDAFYGASGEFIGPIAGKAIGTIAGKAIGNGINATKKKLVPAIENIKTNYKDLNELRDFASTYGYQKPITNIFSNKSVDKTFKNLLNQHNTFTRGVSVNDVTLSNPQILQSLKNNGIYNPDIDKIIPKKKIGEYMATHIPGDTGGYGRFGLDSGDNGLYTSNSYETAKAYTYGDGYVATLRRPVNYNSPSRSN